MARVLDGERRRRTGSYPWPDRRAVPDPFLRPKTYLPDWYPARQSLYGLVLTDLDPDSSIEWFSGIRVPVQIEKLPSFVSVIFSIAV